jgi:pimeloyl-ACP methyl ester carboxylesterase
MLEMPPPRQFRTADGLSLAWYELQAGNDAPPIVLQHGFSSSTWFEWVQCGVAGAVMGIGRRVLGLDARGHGNSEKPHDTSFYGGDLMARDLIAFVRSLGLESYDLVGYSMGGGIAARVAASDPAVRRVVISGVGEGIVGGKVAFDPRSLAAAFRADSDEGLTPIERNMRAGAISRNNDLLALAAHCEAITFAPIDVASISAETLVMAGDTDPMARQPEVIADAVPGARLVLVPGDHWHSKRSPEFSAALVEFLR